MIEPKEKETKRQKIGKNHGASSTVFGKFSSKSAQTLLLGHKKQNSSVKSTQGYILSSTKYNLKVIFFPFLPQLAVIYLFFKKFTFSGSKETFLIHYFKDIRGYLFPCIIFGGRIVFSANLQMMQLKCQIFDFMEYKHNVLLPHNRHSWHHLTLGPHSRTFQLHKRI